MGTHKQLQTGVGWKAPQFTRVRQRLRGSSFTRVLSIPVCGTGIFALLQFFLQSCINIVFIPWSTRLEHKSNWFPHQSISLSD